MRTQAILPGTAAGRIVTENGEPLPSASVHIKGSYKGTVSDGNGFFKLENFPQNSTAIVSAVGFQSKEFPVRPGYYTVRLIPVSNALQEVVVVGYGMSKDEEVSRRSASVAPMKKLKEEIEYVSVNTQYQPTAVVYKIDDKYSLETDGKTTTITIKNFSMPALYDYYVAPKIDPAVFLTAKVVNWQDFDLLPGEANLYFEGTFLGKTYLDLSETSDTLSLSLGKDNGIKITRKLAKEFSAKKLIGSNRTETKQYEITLRNTKKIPISILVQDQFPVSITKEIDVEDVAVPNAQLDKESGIASWNVTLQPGEERKLTISYSVKYPKDKKVVLE